MKEQKWTQEFPAAITVCDAQGVILEMNETACKTFAKYGGADLVGQSLLDCHSEASVAKLHDMMKNQQPNVYTIEKNGQKKLIYQCPWYENKEFKGLVEISLPLPEQMPHFVRS